MSEPQNDTKKDNEPKDVTGVVVDAPPPAVAVNPDPEDDEKLLANLEEGTRLVFHWHGAYMNKRHEFGILKKKETVVKGIKKVKPYLLKVNIKSTVYYDNPTTTVWSLEPLWEEKQEELTAIKVGRGKINGGCVYIGTLRDQPYYFIGVYDEKSSYEDVNDSP